MSVSEVHAVLNCKIYVYLWWEYQHAHCVPLIVMTVTGTYTKLMYEHMYLQF